MKTRPGRWGRGFVVVGSVLLTLMLPAGASAQVSRWTGDGHARDLLRENDGTLVGGVTFGAGVVGQGFHFNGVDGAIRLPDSPSLRITGSLTITAWVKVLGLPSAGQGIAEIFFRGDDRLGLDPYVLGVQHDGMLVFSIDSGAGSTQLRVPMPMGRFVHVTASLDDRTSQMRILFNGQVVAETTTPFRPFRDLDSGANPGIGIGNHGARPNGGFNQPFHGVIDEVTISDQAEGAVDAPPGIQSRP